MYENHLKDHTSFLFIYLFFLLLTISRDRPYHLQMLRKFVHVYTLVDLRCIFKPHLLLFRLKLGMKTLKDMWKLRGICNSPFCGEDLSVFGQKSLSKRERGVQGAVEMKVIMAGKKV